MIEEVWNEARKDEDFVKEVIEKIKTLEVISWETFHVDTTTFAGYLDVAYEDGDDKLFVYPCFFGSTLTDQMPLIFNNKTFERI